MSRCIIVLNRSSGANQRGTNAREVARSVEQIFREGGHEISSRVVQPRKLPSALKQAVAEKPDIILVGGGDGTVATAAGLLKGTGIALGILPMGTFNLAARDLGIPLEIHEAARFLVSAETREIDILEVAGRSCLCTTIFGFYPEYSAVFENRESTGGRWWKKAFNMVWQLRHTFLAAKALDLSWHGGGEDGRARTKFSAFVPGSYRQSPGLIPSRTDFQSGTLTAYIGTQESATAAFRGIVDYTLGTHENNPELRIFRTPELVLDSGSRDSCMAMIDGEILKLRFPIRMQILPGQLRVLISKESSDPA